MKYLYTVFIALLFISNSEMAVAGTVFSTAQPTAQEEITMTGACCSGADGFKEYSIYFKIPQGITFDRVALSGQIISGSPTLFLRRKIDNSPLYNSFYGIATTLTQISADSATGTTIFPSLSNQNNGLIVTQPFTPITTGANEYLEMFLDSGSFVISRNVQFEDGLTYNVQPNGFEFKTTKKTQAFILCDGECDTVNFNPLPQVTATPFVRITRPFNNSLQPFDTNFIIDSNTGTSTADRVVVEFSSSNQNFIPYEYDLNVTGLQTESFTYPFPLFEDTITARAVLYSSTTVIATSSEVIFSTREDAPVIDEIQCNQDNFIVRGICEVFVYLLYPSDLATDTLSDLWNDIKNKPPFGYLVSIFDQLNAIDDNATPAFSFGTVPFIDTIFDPIKDGIAVILWGFWGIWLYNKRLTKLDI